MQLLELAQSLTYSRFSNIRRLATIAVNMSKLNSKLSKSKMTESKKSSEDNPGYLDIKVEVRRGSVILQ